MSQLDKLWPYPRNLKFCGGDFTSPSEVYISGDTKLPSFQEDLKIAGISNTDNPSTDYCLELMVDGETGTPESYTLNMDTSLTKIVGADDAGLAYGLQTFLQILSIYRGTGAWPSVQIEDAPTYKKRCFMLDMGRSIFNMPILKRVIRILARLKMNQLHLHLYDDPLCGIKFNNLPFGHDNPYAITLDQLGELVSYAAQYNIEIVPELEGWAHVTSIVYHRPELRGGDGMYNGSSFLISNAMFELMKELTRQVAAVMPDKATIHFGLDEAQWHVDPSMPEGYSPEDMVRDYYNMLQEVGKELGKDLTMRVWADHGGRAIPQEIQHNTIIEPWQYWKAHTDLIDKQIERYSSTGKMRFMMGAGQSSEQHRGAFHATRYWCEHAQSSPNVDGVNITFWGVNDIADKLCTLFAGAQFAWNPNTPLEWAHSEDYEEFDHFMFAVMRWWQSNFRDAYPDDLRKESAPYVYYGYYMWGDRHGEPVGPAAPMADTLYEHNFLVAGRGIENQYEGLPH